MTLPRPEPGLVIRYSYLWASEHRAGRVEGSKDRPCAIILVSRTSDDETDVLVVPVTHTAPSASEGALELPPGIKRALGLDETRSWAVYGESNVFAWPGPDLRRVAGQSIAYGLLPPRFFAELKKRFVDLERSARRRVRRTE